MRNTRIMLVVALIFVLGFGCSGADDPVDGDADGDYTADGDTSEEDSDFTPDGDVELDGDTETEADVEEELDSSGPYMAVTTTAHLKLEPTLDPYGYECEGFESNDYCRNPAMDMPDLDVYFDYGMGAWTVEDGEEFSLNEELGFERGEVAEEDRRSLFVWAHLSDVHITDEESPNRMAAFDSKAIPSALRPMDMYTEVVLNSAVNTINAFNALAPIDAVVVSGDFTDNAQLNEAENFMKVMGGGEVNPDSGADDDPVTGEANDPQDPFFATGLENIPWIVGFGNHDALILGNWEITDTTIAQAVGDSAITGTRNGESYFVESGTVVADAERTPVHHQQMIDLFLNDNSKPAGHGFTGDNYENDTGYYTWDPSEDSLVRFIMLDTTFRPQGYEGQGTGSSYVDPVIDIAQYEDFLKPELERAANDKKLVIVVNHHPSQKLQDDNIPNRFITTEELQGTLKSYPNVLVHCVGHSHENTVWPRINEDGGGYFEVQSSSLIDWPQQMRFYELVDNGNGTLSVFTVVVDHQSENDDSMSEYSRKLALIDVQTGWGEGGAGLSIERNVEMVFSVPEGFEDLIANANGGKVQALTTWLGEVE